MPSVITDILNDTNVVNAAAILNDLIAKMSLYPPTRLDTQSSVHFYEVYRSKLASDVCGFEKMLLMKVQIEIASRAMVEQLAPPMEQYHIFQLGMTLEECRKKSQVNYCKRSRPLINK